MSWTSRRRSLGFSSFLIRFVLNRTTFGRKLECFIYSTITFHKLFFTLLSREQALVEGLGPIMGFAPPLCVPGSLFHRSSKNEVVSSVSHSTHPISVTCTLFPLLYAEISLVYEVRIWMENNMQPSRSP
uniref:Uncharacterized protein n=1 Tax=Phlegmariurus squarrosus TaxID=73615 RepID=H9M848_PHLSQ|nr:hypothetical protein HusqMp50 [Phlegmariurus squarrosus]AEV55755.1 hypothetical protein HusqMp50 [Phlegmariurus squarrosus]